jgi:hypothetical protein
VRQTPKPSAAPPNAEGQVDPAVLPPEETTLDEVAARLAEVTLGLVYCRMLLGRYRVSGRHHPDSTAAHHLREHGHDLAEGCCRDAA